MSRFAVLLALGCAPLLCALPARAQIAPGQADRALATFTPAELTALAPLLRTGTVSLVEFATADQVPAVVIATEVDATPAEVAAVIGEPGRYPEFMPALDEVTIESDAGGQLAYAWGWHTSVFTLRGTNTMQQYAPPRGHPEMGYRFVVRSTGGDLGEGRTVWRVLPRPGGRSLLMTSSRMNLQDANYLARQLSAGGTSINRTVNIAINFAMLLRTRMEAERRAGHVRPALATPSADPVRPVFDAVRLERLFGRGDLMWVETSGDDLGRVAVIGAMHTPEPITRAAMLDPEGFTRGLLVGSSASVLERDPSGVRFEWAIDLPLVGTSGQMHLGEHTDGRVHLDGVQGALAGARWRFETIARPYGTLVVTWGRFDPAEGLWLLRVVTEADGAFRPGLGSAAQLMMVRGLRTRLIRGI
ncbi:MAG: SRPBCC family protein [Myxococcota bacterium]|nr:SRPBCC family protein [Myxococcota bacterium]